MIPALCRYRAPVVVSSIKVVSSSQGGAENGTLGSAVNSIPAPAGIVAGNLLLAVFSSDDSVSPTSLSCSGWTLLKSYLFTTHNNDGNMGVFWKIATASEPAAYSFDQTKCYAMNMGIIQLSGVNASNPFGGVAPTAAKAIATTTPVFPAITLAQSMAVLEVVAQAGNYSGSVSTSYTPPTGYTLAVASTSQSNGAATWDSEATFAALSTALIPASTYTPPSGTLSKSYAYGALSVALNPA